jgi:hypothetical protein
VYHFTPMPKYTITFSELLMRNRRITIEAENMVEAEDKIIYGQFDPNQTVGTGEPDDVENIDILSIEIEK